MQHKRILKRIIFNIKEFRVKSNIKRVTLLPNLVFNWVMFLISNGKFRSFLVRTLIQKDKTDNKVFKREFYAKETRKKGIEKNKVLQIFV